METKICGTCKKKLPKTDEYFFRRIIKQKLANGSIVEYLSYKSSCKKCFGKKGNERRIRNRCAEMGCSINEYRTKWKEQYSKTRRLYPEINDLPEHIRIAVRIKIHKGYIYTTYDQYKLDCRSNVSMARRKYDYGSKKILSEKDKNSMAILKLTNARLALGTGMSVREIPEEVLETKRLIITLKRELKSNNIKIR